MCGANHFIIAQLPFVVIIYASLIRLEIHRDSFGFISQTFLEPNWTNERKWTFPCGVVEFFKSWLMMMMMLIVLDISFLNKSASPYISEHFFESSSISLPLNLSSHKNSYKNAETEWHRPSVTILRCSKQLSNSLFLGIKNKLCMYIDSSRKVLEMIVKRKMTVERDEYTDFR